VAEIPVAVETELVRLRAENARLLRLLKLTPQQAAPPDPAQAACFEAPPGLVHDGSPPDAKVAFFGALFAARTDVYAVRYNNPHTGKGGWVPAVRGGWRKGVRHEDRGYLPLTPAVLASHLKGEVHIGLYPLLDGDKCWWVAADFDGPEAMFDALMYVKAGRTLQVPVALEVSRSGVGAHAWVFFTSPVPAETARRLGAGLLREAMALRGRMNLASCASRSADSRALLAWIKASLEAKEGSLGLLTTQDRLMPTLLPGILELSRRGLYRCSPGRGVGRPDRPRPSQRGTLPCAIR
jgi:hypothetical protein